MPKRNSTVEIVDGKVVLSQEIIDYFENLRTIENSEWIDKYFEVLNDENNLNAKKYNCHHIRPCFSFKDETHNTREETEPLANEIKENLIKLSIYNHIKAHYFLWKIYNNIDSKVAFQKMCGQHRYINNITEKELDEISILQENCAKENQTEEDVKRAIKEWNKTEKGKASIKKSQEKYSNSEHGKQTRKRYFQSEEGRKAQRKSSAKYRNSEKGKAYIQEWSHSEKGKESRRKSQKKRTENGKSKEYQRKWRKTEKGKESFKKSQEKYNNSEKGKTNRENYKKSEQGREVHKKSASKYYYSEKGQETSKKYRTSEKGKESQRKAQKKYAQTEKGKETRKRASDKSAKRLCYDPKKENFCTYATLRSRVKCHPDSYKDVNLLECVIK